MLPQPPGASAVLGLGLATTEPHFTLVRNGEPALTLSSPSALFHVLLLFLQARPAQVVCWQAHARPGIPGDMVLPSAGRRARRW